MAIGTLIYGGIHSEAYGCYVTDAGIYTSSEHDVTSYAVPGRNGDLHIDNGRMKNVTVPYPAFIASGFDENFIKYRSALMALRGYQRIEDSFDKEHFRLGKITKGVSGKVHAYDSGTGKFQLSFDCKPQLFLKSGEETITITQSGDTIMNLYPHASKPLIRVYGHGSLSVGSGSFTVGESEAAYVAIDCDSMQAFEGEYNRNNILTVIEWAELLPCENAIIFDSTISKVEIVPRWYEL